MATYINPSKCEMAIVYNLHLHSVSPHCAHKVCLLVVVFSLGIWILKGRRKIFKYVYFYQSRYPFCSTFLRYCFNTMSIEYSFSTDVAGYSQKFADPTQLLATDDPGSKPDQIYMIGGEIGKITWEDKVKKFACVQYTGTL